MTRVLLVEDNTELAESILRALAARGHDVQLAETLDAAFAAYESESTFDFVLCDYELPVHHGGLNNGKGTDFLREVLKHDPHPYTVLWSGLDRTREAQAEGVTPDTIMTKDNTVEVLDLIEGSSA